MTVRVRRQTLLDTIRKNMLYFLRILGMTQNDTHFLICTEGALGLRV